jgi:hypothetical protein
MQKQKPPSIGGGPSEDELPEGASPDLLAAAQKAKDTAQKVEHSQDHDDGDDVVRICVCGYSRCGTGPFVLWRRRGKDAEGRQRYEAVNPNAGGTAPYS